MGNGRGASRRAPIGLRHDQAHMRCWRDLTCFATVFLAWNGLPVHKPTAPEVITVGLQVLLTTAKHTNKGETLEIQRLAAWVCLCASASVCLCLSVFVSLSLSVFLSGGAGRAGQSPRRDSQALCLTNSGRALVFTRHVLVCRLFHNAARQRSYCTQFYAFHVYLWSTDSPALMRYSPEWHQEGREHRAAGSRVRCTRGPYRRYVTFRMCFTSP